MLLPAGRTASVRSPATSANLGPGFDCLGLALQMWDQYTATTVEAPGVRVASAGEGADRLPCDATHLVARSLLIGLAHAGVEPEGLQLQCRNAIPHGRGLGSSSAAIVGGLVLARGLLDDPGELNDDRLVELASNIEGHPDNVAAAVLGGATISWLDDEGAGRAVRFGVQDQLAVTVLVPQSQAETEAARGLLPADVPFRDAVFNVSRAALMVHALARDPQHLFTASADRLHQDYRATAYPASLAAVRDLRSKGIAAAISGAGPTVIAFADRTVVPEKPGFESIALAVSGKGAHSQKRA